MFAELERDPQTRSLIAQIEAMKQAIPAADGAPACDPPDHSIAEPGDPGVLNGVWRSERPTYEEGIEAGLSESTAAQEMGAQTIRMRNGRYEWDWRPRSGDGYCVGRYEVGGNRVTFKDALPCEGVWEARFRLQGDEVHWSAVRYTRESRRISSSTSCFISPPGRGSAEAGPRRRIVASHRTTHAESS